MRSINFMNVLSWVGAGESPAPAESLSKTPGGAPAERRRLWATMEQEKPKFSIGSPMCKAFSQLQTLSAQSRDPDKCAKLVAGGISS